MNTIFVLLMVIPSYRAATSVVAEFNDEKACYSAAITLRDKLEKDSKEVMRFVCMPKETKK